MAIRYTRADLGLDQPRESRAVIPAPISPTFGQLAEELRDSLQHDQAANTKAIYESAWKSFEAFCKSHGRPALPATTDTVVAYVQYIAKHSRPDPRKGHEHKTLKPAKISTIEVHVAAIKRKHIMAKATDPTEALEFKLSLRALKRELAEKRTGQVEREPKATADLDVIKKIAAALGDEIEDVRDRALILVGFAGAFRRSELVNVTRRDMTFTADGMIIKVRKSKTDQTGKGLVKHFVKMDDQSICPVTALRAWLDRSEIGSGYIFKRITRWHVVTDADKPLDSGSVALIIKRACIRAGIDPADFAGHSLRRGFITEAARAGAKRHEITRQTGHSPNSRTMDNYIDATGIDARRAVQAAFGEVV